MTSTVEERWSDSVRRALLWAQASAALDGTDRPVLADDLFVGILLSHPDSDSEMWALLHHFEITARDLLPDEYPTTSAETLGRAAATVDRVDERSWSEEVADIVDHARRPGGTPQLAHVMAGLITQNGPFQRRFDQALSRFGLSGRNVAGELSDYLLSPDGPEAIDLSSAQVTAGEQIAKWLTDHVPLQPAAMAAFSGDNVDGRADLIGVSVEADAFAYLIASKDLTPPLAIGLFGDWGSGKSFLMEKIKRRVAGLTDLATRGASETQVSPRARRRLAARSGDRGPAAPGLCKTIAAIDFNAWQYVETDLWAALLSRIFDTLTPGQQQLLSEADQERAAATPIVDAKAQALANAHTELRAAREKRDDLRAQRDEADAAVVKAAAQADRLHDPMVRDALKGRQRAVLAEQMTAAVDLLGEDAKTAVGAARDVQHLVRQPVWRNRAYWSTRWAVLAALSVAVVPLATWLLPRLIESVPAATVSTLLAVLGGIAGALRSLHNVAIDAEKKVDEKLAVVRQAAEEQRDRLDAQVKASEVAVEGAAEISTVAEREHEEAVRRRDAITPSLLYREFLAARSSTDDYRKRLSLVSIIDQDLRRLSRLTQEYNADTASDQTPPPNRIVLYVDDLDRCPPKRIVEVLEAVHLLLAFPLFVVVVAVDTRLLEHAVEAQMTTLDQASRFVRPGAPTAEDYLEKIFQIPFWVEKLDDEGRRRLLRGLLAPSVARPGVPNLREVSSEISVGARERDVIDQMLTDYGTGLDLNARQLTITAEELTFVESLATLLTGTPRAAKRFVNTCQLVLAMSPPLSSDGPCPTERMAACFMTALHQAMPGLAAALAEAAAENDPLSNVLKRAGNSEDAVRLGAWLAEHDREHNQHAQALFENTKAQVFTVRWPMIRRLRFETTSAAPNPDDQPSPPSAAQRQTGARPTA